MESRGTLHGRHHSALQPNVLIVDTFPGLEGRVSSPNGAYHHHHHHHPATSATTIHHDDDDDDDQHPEARLLLAHDQTKPNSSNIVALEAIDPEARVSRGGAGGGGVGGAGGGGTGTDVESITSPATSDPGGGRSWDDTYRFRKSFKGLQALDTLDVMRESSRLLRRQSDLLTTLTAAFIVPVSVVVLTHVFVTRPVIWWLENQLQDVLLEKSVTAAINTRYMNYVYLELAEFLVTSVLYIPLALTLAALAKIGIVYTVASTYAGVKVSFVDVILHRVVPRVWLPFIITYASSYLIFLGATGIVLLCLGFSSGFFAAVHTSSALALFYYVMLGLAVCAIFIYLKIISNVAGVICILEDKCGFAALARSLFIVRGRVRVAFATYLVTFVVGGFITLLFEFRVTDKNSYTEYNSSGAWEGPLLVLMHSFVYMFDDIMVTVFFFTCPRSWSTFEALDASRVPDTLVGMTSL